MILLDTSGLLAAFRPTEPQHAACRTIIENEREPGIISPFVLCELDYLVVRDYGVDAELQLVGDVAAGAYDLARFDEVDVARAAAIIKRYDDRRIGLADASIVVLAERYETNRVLTLDERHFRALRVKGKKFVVLPADA
ncbi:MAG: PIN domain-containing protein [Gaiellaceae bacterium]